MVKKFHGLLYTKKSRVKILVGKFSFITFDRTQNLMALSLVQETNKKFDLFAVPIKKDSVVVVVARETSSWACGQKDFGLAGGPL